MLTNTKRNKKLKITCVYECRTELLCASKWETKSCSRLESSWRFKTCHGNSKSCTCYSFKPIMNITDSSTSLAIGGCQEIVIIYSYTIQKREYGESPHSPLPKPNSTLVQRSLSKCVTIISHWDKNINMRMRISREWRECVLAREVLDYNLERSPVASVLDRERRIKMILISLEEENSESDHDDACGNTPFEQIHISFGKWKISVSGACCHIYAKLAQIRSYTHVCVVACKIERENERIHGTFIR